MKICWLTNYCSPYKLKLFEEISKYAELTALVLGDTEGENRNSEWSFSNNRSFNLIKIDKKYISTINKLAKESDVFIDSLYCTIYGYIGTSIFKNYHKKTIMYADGGIAIDRGVIVNKTLSFLMNRHDVFFSSGPHCDKYFKYYGVNEDLIFHYKFSSLTSFDIENHKNVVKNKKEYRKELGIDDKFTIISIGQPIERKGFDLLLEAYINTQLTEKINLYIIGGKPQEKIEKIVKDNNLNNVHFIGLLNSEELKKYYATADAFVLCTREDIWGLVIEEAMSYGLPTITSDNCAAGVHFNNINESVIIREVKDINGYCDEIIKIFNNDSLRNELKNKTLQTIKDYTIENSAVDIIENLNDIII